jgi:hypothetical protein
MMSDDGKEPEVLEPEVLPPEPGNSKKGPENRSTWINDRIKAIGIGLALDALDLITLGPSGLIGFLIGFIVTFYLLGLMKIDLQRRILYSVGAGIYCLIPGTERIPLGTILGTLFGLKRNV